MHHDYKLQLGSLEEKLNGLPFAITVSDLTLPDQPLVYLNRAFTEMTGFGEDMLGENCRFLQKDTENEAARAEIREAIAQQTKCQVVLKNRRRNGEPFNNLLMLDVVKGIGDDPPLALGSQFELGREDLDNPDPEAVYTPYEGSNFAISLSTKLRIEQRRIVAQSASRLLQSWCILKGNSAT